MTKVTIYTTPICAYCKAAKQYFADHNIEYTEVDVAADQAAARMIVAKSGQMGVPIISIEKDGQEELVIGFDQPKLARLLGLV